MGSRKSVSIEGLKIGGGAPVRVESMLKTRLTDIAGGAEETAKLAAAGCELARVALPEQSLAAPFAELIKKALCRLWRTSTLTTDSPSRPSGRAAGLSG